MIAPVDVPPRRARSNVKNRILLVLSLSLLAGCGGSGRSEDIAKAPIPMGKVPAAVFKAAQSELPEVAFTAASREGRAGQETYELSGADKAGKPRSVQLSRQGKVMAKK